jgi:hypothetical protein
MIRVSNTGIISSSIDEPPMGEEKKRKSSGDGDSEQLTEVGRELCDGVKIISLLYV